MNFAELRFWGLLLLSLAIIGALRLGWSAWRPQALPQFDRLSLMLLGMFLLGCVSWLTFAIWLAVSLTSYFGLQWILQHDPGSKRKYLFVLIPLQLAPLLYYKYANFISNEVLALEVDWLRGMVIPVGISFYTFQKIAFVIDTLAFRERLPGLINYMNFVGFFPQIVAGPIERKRDLLPQMERFRFRWDRQQLDEGVGWIAVGLFFKMCLADNLARWMPAFVGSTDNPYMIWTANLLFGLRIYYDFAGYSLIAVGLGRCLGIKLTLNFLSPYCSTNVVEFWRRWHITLSQWFRDYLYVPLGGGRVRWWSFNVALVFLVSGIWHGAGWNFVLWGALHGVFLILLRLSGRWTLPAPVAWMSTMFAVFFAWLAFYELRTEVLWAKFKTLFVPGAYRTEALLTALRTLPRGELVVPAGLLVIATATLTLEWLSVRRLNEPYAWLRRPLVLASMVVLTVFLASGKHNAFIYFAF